MSGGNRFVRGVMIAVAIIVVLGLSGWSMLLYSDAVIDWWIVPVAASGIGLALSIHMWRLWRPLTWSDSALFNGLCNTVVTAVCLTFAFFALNDMLADDSTRRVETAVVAGHFREEHHRTRRVGRRYVANGEAYYTYKLQLRFADGSTKLVEMPRSSYSRIHNGDSATVVMRDGLFGVSVFDHRNLEFYKGESGKKLLRN